VATIDDKVVAMSFEASKFEQGVNKSISAIERLKATLHFPNAGKGLEDVGRAAQGLNLSRLGNSVDQIKNRLGALRLAGIAVFANLASSAVAAGTRMIKSLTIDPVVAGFHNYETQINAVQTILANTGLKGKKGIDQVNASLAELQTYANKTVYNFSEMARNIGTFTAAGVDLKTSTASIKGIANLAALSGSTSEQASSAMYQLSQAIAAGQVHLQDWNSVVNAGIGGKVFQKALANTAQAMGTLKDGSVKLVGPMKQLQINGESFRQALQTKPGVKSWLTSDVLTNTLKQFTGDMTKAQLKAQGFTDAQIKAIQAQGQVAQHAATNIKTFTQLQQALKEEVATAWGSIFKTIFGNLGDATHLFSAIHTTAENALTIPIYNLNKLLEGWAKLGGRTALISGLHNAFRALGAVMAPIKAAFRDIFPAQTAKGLADATKRFEEFTKTLKPSPQTVENLRRTFRGLFAVLDIGKQIVSGIFHVFGMLFGAVGKGSGGFLDFTGTIGDFLVKVDETLKKGNLLHNFFNLLGTIILAPIHALEQLTGAVSNSTQGLHPLQAILNGVSQAYATLTGQVKKSNGIIHPIISGIAQAFTALGQAIAGSLQSIDFSSIFAALGVAFTAGIAVMIKRLKDGGLGDALVKGLFGGTFTEGLGSAFKGVGETFSGIGGVMKGLTGNLDAMQKKLKSEALKNIAIAIALIAASAVALSLVNPQKLNSALGSLTIMFGQLLGAMAILDKVGKSGGFIKLPVIAASMVLLAGAIDLLTLAVLGLSRLNWNQLAKGLTGIGAILAGISVSAGPLGRNSAGLIRAGVGISAIGVALNILALAVRQFGSMDMATLGKGLGAVAAALAGIGTASRLFPAGMIQMGAGLAIVAGALLLLSKSVKAFGTMQWATIGKGLAGVAGAIVAIGLAMRLMPKGMVAQAVALGIVALAIGKIADAISKFGGMSVGSLVKGIGGLAIALGILAIALAAMEGSLPGAAALVVAAGAIAILAPALKTIGDMSVGELIKSMIGLAAAMALLGAAGILLAPITPALLALGAAMVLIGGGFALVGAGVALVGIGLSAIAVSAPVSIGILIKALETFLEAIPKVAESFVNALLSIVQKLAETAPQFVAAIVKIVSALVNAIPPLAPKLGEAFLALVTVALHVLVQAFPKIVAAGAQMLIQLLKGISQHIVQVTNMAVQIVTRFLGAIANNIPKIMAAGLNVVLKFVQGIANNITRVVTVAADIIAKFVTAIGSNASKLVRAGADALAKFLNAIAAGETKVIRAGTNLIVHFITGIGNAGARIVAAASSAMGKFINAMATASLRLVDTGARAVIRFLNGVASAIRKYEPQLVAAGVNIGKAIVQGMISGLGSLAGSLFNKVKSLANGIPGFAKKALGIHSPSSVFHEIGENVVLGFAAGLSSSKAVRALTDTVRGMLDIFDTVWQLRIAKMGPDNIRLLFGLGNDISTSFYNGLLSGFPQDTPDPITQAFSDIVKQIAGNQDDLEKSIQDETKSIKQSNSDIKQDWEALNQARKKKDKSAERSANQSKKQHQDEKAAAIDAKNANEALLGILRQTSGFILTDPSIKKWTADLAGQRALVEQLNNDLTTQTQKLDDLKSKRDSLFQQTFDKLSALPGIVSQDANGNPIDPVTQVNNYVTSLSNADDVVGVFTNTMDQLQNLGLNADTYQQLLDIGPAAQSFADALVKLGPSGIAGINAADNDLRNAAQVMAQHGSDEMYATGISIAEGLVKGINDSISTAVKTAEALATSIVKAIKKKLKIKSPSEVFAEIGTFMNQGLARGLVDSSDHVATAVSSVADTAISAMHDALSGIDPNPTITPVLDLTQIQSGADSVNSIFAGLNPAVSSLHANAISPQVASNIVGGTPDSVIKFEQNNYSPESLSAIEIYRQTRNQLAQAKPVFAP
jgi:tape measure domain-containing protein